ncbi:MAG: hypothetical protein QOC82_590 [Frankiaceae bacterium]|jgi:hypothetical protein|nr:hypothetical protein [Frankiaceae bacterium]
MVDTVSMQEGRPPWKPTLDSAVIAEYRYYDIPLIGVIEQGDRRYLFWCLDGADEPLSLWFYAYITEGQIKRLEAAHEDFDEVFRAMDFEGWGRLALATPNVGIVDYEDFDMDDHPESVRVAIRKLKERVHQLSALADEFEPPMALAR